MATAKLASCG